MIFFGQIGDLVGRVIPNAPKGGGLRISRPAKLSEQVGVGAGAGEGQREDIAVDSVN